jgi:hypothetical protein
VKLFTNPFDRVKKRLREFIESVDVTFELVHPSKNDILVKFVKSKITGDARSKLIERDLMHTLALVKGILELIYGVGCTLEFCECRMCSARQEKGERGVFWGSRID